MEAKEAKPHSDPRVRTGRWLAVGIGLFLASQFISSVLRIATGADGRDSKFGETAFQEHLGYLIGLNLWVGIGYLLLGLAGWWLLRPLAALPPLSGLPRRWRPAGLVVLGVVASQVVHWYFELRMAWLRPYFLGGDGAVFRLMGIEVDPSGAGHLARWFWLRILPLAAVAAAGLWWWLRLGRRGRVVLATAVVLAAVVPFLGWRPGGSGSPAPADDGRPNVIIIGSDSLRGDRLGYAGYRPGRSDGAAADGVSPRIDAWARDAMVFETCRVPLASTLESGITLMSAMPPRQHGIRHMFPARDAVEAMEARIDPLPEVFSEAGYDTLAIGDWCAGYYEVSRLGFDEVDVSTFDNFRVYLGQIVMMGHHIVPLYFDNGLGYRLFPAIRSSANFVTPDVVTGRVEQRLARQARSGRPFFWHVFYSCNHLPYRSGEPYCRMFGDPDYRGPNAAGVDFDINEFISGTDLEAKWKALPQAEVRQIRALYDGCTRQFDDCFGRLLEALEHQGLADNTIVVLTADHGDDLYEPEVTLGHGLSFNGSDRSYHVPLAIRVPGGGGGRFEESVRLHDIAPTLAGLAGLQPRESWSGVDLSPWLGDPAAARDLPFYGETQFPFIQFRIEGVERPPLAPMDEMVMIDPSYGHQFVLRPEYIDRVIAAKQRCLRTRDWKLVLTPRADGGWHRQLFHTAADPDCRADLASAEPEVAAAMEAALRGWMDDGRERMIEEIFPRGEPANGAATNP